MKLGFGNKVAIVTGGSSGIGEAIALGLCQEGATVVIVARDKDKLHEAAQRIAARTGGHAHVAVADVTSAGDVSAMVSETAAKYGRIDALVNSAGRRWAGQLESSSDEEWTSNIELNLLGTVRCVRAVLPYMIRQKGGSIVNIAATSAVEPRPAQIISNAAKAAVVNFTKTLALNVAKYNIRANCVNPGQILTPQRRKNIGKLAAERHVPENLIMEEQARNIPLGRLGDPNDVASTVLFLLSDQANFLTAVSINIDGGETHHI